MSDLNAKLENWLKRQIEKRKLQAWLEASGDKQISVVDSDARLLKKKRRAVNPATASPYTWHVALATVENAAEIIAGNELPEKLGVKSLDDFTLQARLEQPLPYFPEMTAYATFFPVHRAMVETHGIQLTKPENMVSNGTYVLMDPVPNEFHSREHNSYCWNNETTIIETVIGRVVNEENQALSHYFADKLDHIRLPTGQNPN